jgi:hypothetical protein
VRVAKAGLRIHEVASFEHPRRFGASNLRTFRDGTRVLMTILRERLAPIGPARAPRRPAHGSSAGIGGRHLRWPAMPAMALQEPQTELSA